MIKNYERTYIRTLSNLTKNLSNGLRCKHAAMLVSKNKIISIGVNKTKSDPLQKQYTRLPHMSYIHAEVDCLKGIDMDFSKTTLFVIRTDSDGNMMESCPCDGCMRLVTNRGIPRIIHSNTNGKLTEIIKDY
jgi:deoxycytidylate deaminase